MPRSTRKVLGFFLIAGILGIISSQFLIVQIADATIFDLVFGFFLLLTSFLLVSAGISDLIRP
ncbi:MAG: hypothetical protein ACE1ZC_02165 [Nitrososphaerales archaeon]|nr:hypothetical protein [Nitrososphaerota archaeon]